MAAKRAAEPTSKAALIRLKLERRLKQARREMGLPSVCVVCGEPVPAKAKYCDILCVVLDAITEATRAPTVVKTAKAMVATAIKQKTIARGLLVPKALRAFVQQYATELDHGSNKETTKTQRASHRRSGVRKAKRVS